MDSHPCLDTGGHRLFVIPDLHGRADLLAAAEARVSADATVVCLGDYIDRGPDSAGVLDRLLQHPDWHLLKGNHEQMLLAALEATNDELPDTLFVWLYNGGVEAAVSLGVAVPSLERWSSNPGITASVALRDELMECLGEDRLALLRGLKGHARFGNALCVHAGVHPDHPLGASLAQAERNTIPEDEARDPLWIRWPFLFHEGTFEDDVVVVHGHTIRPDPEIRSNRIGLDVGAYRRDRLAVLEAESNELTVHLVTASAPEPVP